MTLLLVLSADESLY